ncbi:ABC transporter permease subunit [Streptomyces sp. 3MP-14]|uniref:Maltose/maltodextrin transport system permease protein n=1 Tax=Streptomyces mimosae TaxID=2586635 RepID=A0A5N6ADS1_9ACTN|nr:MULTISPECIES: ABC transporter permease subunit [Streptomyces]KAB8166967.1 ABC transporter permease subunit [Streptomyces mimosae]KAB8176908.1 ABC transporter permease subunit [Streptomyces sp. 3MP-14]
MSTTLTPSPTGRPKPPRPPRSPLRPRGSAASRAAARRSPMAWTLTLIAMVIIDVFTLVAVSNFLSEGTWYLAGALFLTVFGVNVVALVPGLVPMRWLAPGIALLVMLTIAPQAYSFYIAFTNYSSDHLLNKDQAVEALESVTYLPEGAATYDWRAYENEEGETLLVVKPGEDPAAAPLVAEPGEALRPYSGGELADDGYPAEVDGFAQLDTPATARALDELTDTEFGPADTPITIQSMGLAGEYEYRYRYQDGVLTDVLTDREYRPVEGTFTSADGQFELSPSFQTTVGWDNFTEIFTNPGIRGPLLEIFLWTIFYAVAVVVGQLVIGMIIALALNSRDIPRRLAKIIRSLLLLPYVVPMYLTVLVWAAMLNANLGIITELGETVFGLDRNWLGDPTMARFALLLVTFWLGFPYFLLIVSGALQAIPEDLLEAAQVEGAGWWARFRLVVFPLLMRMISPLIILGMVGNFNNFVVTFLLNSGGPPMTDTDTPAGSTDLLISYTYKLAFVFGNGSDYAQAAVITMMIFVVLIPVVASQFRRYAVWAEEN